MRLPAVDVLAGLLAPAAILVLDRAALTFQGPFGASPWYPSLSLALALGVYMGRRAILPVFVGYFLATVFVWTIPLGLNALWSIIVKTAVGVGAGIWLGRDPAVRQGGWPLASVLRFAGIAVCAALCTTLVGNLFYLMNGPDAGRALRRLGAWLAGDFVGIFVFSPALLLALAPLLGGVAGRSFGSNRTTAAELLIYLGLAGVLIALILPRSWQSHHDLFFLFFVLEVAAALRLGFAGAAWLAAFIDAAMLLVFGLTVVETMMQADPIHLVVLQLFAATLAGTGLVLGSTIDGYRRVRRELDRHRERLEQLIAERTAQLRSEVEERRQAQAALAEANRLLETQLSEREQALLAAKHEAEEASRAKTRFLQNISHELRTPLNAILGFGGMILTDSRGPLRPAVYRDYVAHMVEAGEHLKALVERLLNLEQAEEDAAFALGPVDAVQAARRVIDLMAPAAKAKRVRLRLQAGEGLPPVQAEEARLRQVLLNLVDNAVKYGPAGQTVTVTVEKQEGGAGAGEGEAAGAGVVRIMVDDEGPGVPRAQRAYIFERFGRLQDADTADSPSGLGIGLYVVRRMVHAFGGAIQVDDAPGGGARFIVTLPIATARETP